MRQLALETEEPFYFVPHVATPLGAVALAPLRVNDASSWLGEALRELEEASARWKTRARLALALCAYAALERS